MAASAETLHVGELEVRLADGLVLAAGAPMTLSVREFELLAAMTRRVGVILTRKELFETVWGGELHPGNRSVDVYVSKLRAKLECEMPNQRFIHTHPGFGYRFQAEPIKELALPQAQVEASQQAGVNGLSHDLHIEATSASRDCVRHSRDVTDDMHGCVSDHPARPVTTTKRGKTR